MRKNNTQLFDLYNLYLVPYILLPILIHIHYNPVLFQFLHSLFFHTQCKYSLLSFPQIHMHKLSNLLYLFPPNYKYVLMMYLHSIDVPVFHYLQFSLVPGYLLFAAPIVLSEYVPALSRLRFPIPPFPQPSIPVPVLQVLILRPLFPLLAELDHFLLRSQLSL